MVQGEVRAHNKSIKYYMKVKQKARDEELVKHHGTRPEQDKRLKLLS